MVRVRRMVMAERAQPRMIDGMIIWLRLAHGSLAKGTNWMGGDHPQQIYGKTITIVPSQKLGTASIRMEKERAT